jgi:carbonic anhydrase/acetyltransferase-like protein (isoleucine patch superfamily)
VSEENKKYELVDVGDDFVGHHKVYRVKALRDFGFVSKGDVGGFVESEKNLSHEGNCWVKDNAYVVDNARVYEDAIISGNAWVHDNACVYGNGRVYGDTAVYHNAKVYDNAIVCDHAQVYNSAEAYKDAVVHSYARLRKKMQASRNVIVVDNMDITITKSDDHFHVYQSIVYVSEDYPKKYRKLLTYLDSIDSKNTY